MELNSTDPFAAENSGTARFIGDTLTNCIGADGGVGASGSGGVGNVASAIGNAADFQTMKPANGQKLPNARTDIPHSELVKMLYYLEGELQARDVVIAALRNERVKHFISQLRTKRVQPNDPYAAIFRDKVALAGNMISRESSTQAAQAEMEVRQIIEQQMEQQYQMVSKQRATHVRMVGILTESLENNQRMLQELEEEKRKHEHDTAQGDDITYGLEMERTKLRQELESERQQLKKLEKDLKKLQETLDFERNRQKQIVLLLIAERKKILMKYIEEGKRSEDLAQILAEEKQRSDAIAEGLEEESKKSLRMEEDLEKQTVAFEAERKTLKVNLNKAENRIQDLEQELLQLRNENEALRKQQLSSAAVAGASVPISVGVSGNLATKSRVLSDDACVATPMVNIAKVVQPTATVSSVPVSGPTTGIARSIIPGQNIRSGIATAPLAATPIAAASSPLSATTTIANDVLNSTAAVAAAAITAPSPAKMQPTATIQRAPGGKFSALAAAGSNSQDQPHAVPIAVPPVTVPPAGARGVPPPIPPNKPVVPPKREPSLSRIGSISGASGGGGGGVAANVASAGVATNVAVATAALTTAAGANANVK